MIRPLAFARLLRRLASALAGVGLAAVAAGAAAPVKVILDTDMAGDCDDAGALAVLHALADRGEAEILAIVTNRRCPANASAAACAAINRYYGRPGIPIGTDKDGVRLPGRPSPFTAALREEFAPTAPTDDRMPDALPLLRRTLAAQPDGSVVVCSVGALSNLEDLVRSGPDDASPLRGVELVRRKVRQTVIMGGGFPRSANPETNLRLDPAAAVAVVNEWPGPVLWQGFEIGAALITGPELRATPATNPVRRAYALRPYLGQPSLEAGKPSHDQAAVLMAVRGPQPELWELIGPGRVVVDSEGHSQWTRERPAEQRYVRIRGHAGPLQKILGELMAAPPAHRAGP